MLTSILNEIVTPPRWQELERTTHACRDFVKDGVHCSIANEKNGRPYLLLVVHANGEPVPLEKATVILSEFFHEAMVTTAMSEFNEGMGWMLVGRNHNGLAWDFVKLLKEMQL